MCFLFVLAPVRSRLDRSRVRIIEELRERFLYTTSPGGYFKQGSFEACHSAGATVYADVKRSTI